MSQMAKIPRHFFKILRLFPDMEKILFTPDISLTRGNPGVVSTLIIDYNCVAPTLMTDNKTVVPPSCIWMMTDNTNGLYLGHTTGLWIPWQRAVPPGCTYSFEGLYHWIYLPWFRAISLGCVYPVWWTTTGLYLPCMRDCTTGFTYPDLGLYHWAVSTLYEGLPLSCTYPVWGTVPLGCTSLMRDCTIGLYLPWWGTVPLGCTYPDEGLYHWVVPTLMRDCTTGLYLPWWGTVPLGCTYPDEGLYYWVVPTLMRDCTTVLLSSSERKATSEPRASTACSNEGELSVSTTVSNAAEKRRTAFYCCKLFWLQQLKSYDVKISHHAKAKIFFDVSR